MTDIKPPPCVRGMTDWQPEQFSTTVLLPCVRVNQDYVTALRKPLEKLCCKILVLRSIQECSEIPDKRLVLLNPSLVSMFSDLTKEERIASAFEQLKISREDFVVRSFPLTVLNWTPYELLKAILPEDKEGVSGFSRVGHIIHLNLKPQHEEYKSVIGQALLLTQGIRTVVNKSQTIDNTYRNFAMEVLAGENDFQVQVRENDCSFEFDFSRVYWNPRLSSEHSRIVEKMTKTSLLLDACAGVGPFSVPACRTGAQVVANDLNPDSFKWLKVNCDKLKKTKGKIECHNMDARDFIKTIGKTKLVELWTHKAEGITDVHITMNLPALAITFLDVFRGLFKDFKNLQEASSSLLPRVHVYGFSKADDKKKHIKERCEKFLGIHLDENHLEGVTFVRNVAPNKDMLRASFLVPAEVMFDFDPVAPGDIVEDEEEEIVKEDCKKRDRSPEAAESNKKKIVAEPVWFGERL